MSVQPNLVQLPPRHTTGAGSVLDAHRSPSGRGPAGSRWVSARRSSRRHAVALACVATLSVHLLSLTRRLGSDEGGFAMVARHWTDGGPFLYGPEWVDRPPGLIALFDMAQHLGPYGVRLTAALVAVVLVATLADAAETVGGRVAARWAAWTGFALASSVLLQAQRLNGELAAAALVSVSVAALLRAERGATRPDHRVLLGILAGASAATAVLVKQNFVDAFVFAGVLLVLGATTRLPGRRSSPRRQLLIASAYTCGVVPPATLALVWAVGHGGVGALAYATFGFRADASAVMAGWSWDAPLQRLELLGLIACASGLLLLAVHLGWSHRRRLRHLDPLPWAVAATAAAEAVGALAGENFWPHYLIGMVPMVALATGLGARRRSPGRRWTRRLAVLAVATTAVSSPVAAVVAATESSEAWTTGRWVAASAHAGDSLVVPLTHANVIEASGLTPVYPYAWSLPARTLDPDLGLLASTLSGPAAPTWVVRWDPAHTWGLDPAGQVDAALHAHYRSVAVVCGHTVWLHDGAHRSLAPLPASSACGVGAQ